MLVKRLLVIVGFLLLLGWTTAGSGTAAEEPAWAVTVKQPILGPDDTLAEVQQFVTKRIPEVPEFESVESWNAYADQLRRDVLEKVVFRGEAAAWRDADTRVEWLDEIEGGPGYHIRKLRYEALPGLWIPALLYEPNSFEGSFTADGKVPAVLNVNGHDRADGKAADYKQLRCINQAKRGMLALNVEWLGMGQLQGDDYSHYRSNQIDLCGTSGLAPFYLAMSRALDLLLEHPKADPKRMAVAGLSGGGWQTIVISSLDPRVTLANPVAGYSSFRTRAFHFSDLGDSEQTPVDLATVADYAHLTAIRAPRPTLLTYNAEDNCCFKADHALQPLLDAAEPIYQAFGKPERLRWHVNDDPGDHNFELDNRQTLYGMFRDFFASSPGEVSAEEIPSEGEVKSKAELDVPLPAENETFHSLAVKLSDGLPRKATGESKEVQRERLRELIQYHTYEATGEEVSSEEVDGVQTIVWKIALGEDWTVPAVELVPEGATSTAIVLSDAGRAAAVEEVAKLLAAGKRVLVMDVFYFGDAKISQRDFLFALLVSAVGERPLGIQASQIASVARWMKGRNPKEAVSVVALGPRTSTMALLAAGIEAEAIDELQPHDLLESLHQVIDENWTVQQYPELFCFGLLEQFDLPEISKLVEPRSISTAE